MGGTATFSGVNFQAKVIAYIYVHILTQQPLGWFGNLDDKPIAVSGETSGPGDDARIGFGSRYESVEIQAKHGLTAGAELIKTLQNIQSRSPRGDQSRVMLVVDDTSSKSIYNEFRQDLHRIRVGRLDNLKGITKKISTHFSEDYEFLKRIYIVRLNLENHSDSEFKVVLTLLNSRLDNSNDLTSAWSIFETDACELCARRLARTKKELEDLLIQASLKLKPLPKDAELHLLLDSSKKLLEKHKAYPALQFLMQLHSEVVGKQIDPQIGYRIEQQHAAALLQLNRAPEALEHVKRALDFNPNGLHALRTISMAYLQLGDNNLAAHYIDRAIEAVPDDPVNWAVKAQVSSSCGQFPINAPLLIKSSPNYRTALLYIFSKSCQWKEIIDSTGELFRDGIRTPEILFFRAQALLMQSSQIKDEIEQRKNLLEVESLTAELCNLIDEDHPLFVKALIYRAEAGRRSGKDSESQQNLEHARTLSPDDPGVIFQLAFQLLERNEPKEALEILREAIVDNHPMLRLLRARALVLIKDDDEARQEINAALSQADFYQEPDQIRLVASEVALDLHEYNLSLGILESVRDKDQYNIPIVIQRAKIAEAQGLSAEAEHFYKLAVEVDSDQRVTHIIELADFYFKHDRPNDSVQTLEEVKDLLPSRALHLYAMALLEANHLGKAIEIINLVMKDDDLPIWALQIAAEVALRSDDHENAIQSLNEIIGRNLTVVHPRLILIRCLIENERLGEADEQIQQLLTNPQLTPVERMQIAQFLNLIGKGQEAFELAFESFRDAPQNPKIHGAFIWIAMTSKVNPPNVTEVGPDTYVRLIDLDGESHEYSIYRKPPIDKLRNEISLEDANILNLLGLKIGDVLVRHEGTIQESKWEVKEILPVSLHALRDSMLHFEDRFPEEPTFMFRFKIGSGSKIKDFMPIISTLEDRRTHAIEVIDLYRKQTMPLGFIAKSLSTTIPDLTESLSRDADISSPIFVEWSDRSGQDASIKAAFTAKEVVLTRSALHTIQSSGLLETVLNHFVLLAPNSLMQELRTEYHEAENQFKDGYKAIISRKPLFSLNELEAGHPILQQRRDGLLDLIDWVKTHVQLEKRPLDAIKPKDSTDEEAREIGGRSSYDSVVLAERGRSLYADDLGLRRMLTQQAKSRSFSTISLLPFLLHRGCIDKTQILQLQLSLVERNYTFINPSFELLEHAISAYPSLGYTGVVKVFSLTLNPGLTLQESVAILARVIKSVAISQIQIVPVDSVTRMSLDILSSRWPKPLCCQSLLKSIEDQFAFLPACYVTIQRICTNYLKG